MTKKVYDQNTTILCVDFGKANIGTALGRNGLVMPLEVISGKNINTALFKINRLIVENKVEKLVVGLPLTLDDKETAQSSETRRFAKILKVTTKRPVDFQNEYETTRAALNEAIDTDVSEKRRRSNDHLAAAFILRRYYDERS
ncbi:MAG: Holliday junction resolvase RuvX [Patescibacteria group bacterium]